MKGAIIGVTATAIVALLFVCGMAYIDIKGAEVQERRKLEALEYAKQGWVYRCGWDCRWERMEPVKGGEER